MNIRQRIADVLLGDLRALRWTLGWLAFAMGLGFMGASVENENYHLLNALQPAIAWGVLFMAYGALKLVGALYQLPAFVRYTAGLSGLWLWSYLFLSFVVFDGTDLRATELALAVPIVVEVWLLTNAMWHSVELWRARRGT